MPWLVLGPPLVVYGSVLLLWDSERARVFSCKLHLYPAFASIAGAYGQPRYPRRYVGNGFIYIGGYLTFSIVWNVLQHLFAR